MLIKKGIKIKPKIIKIICSVKEMFLLDSLPVKQNKTPILSDMIKVIKYELRSIKKSK